MSKSYNDQNNQALTKKDCKLIQAITKNRKWQRCQRGQYKLGCNSGILDIRYYAADLEAVEAEFPDLLTIPETVVSLTEALRLQNARLIVPHENVLVED